MCENSKLRVEYTPRCLTAKYTVKIQIRGVFPPHHCCNALTTCTHNISLSNKTHPESTSWWCSRTMYDSLERPVFLHAMVGYSDIASTRHHSGQHSLAALCPMCCVMNLFSSRTPAPPQKHLHTLYDVYRDLLCSPTPCCSVCVWCLPTKDGSQKVVHTDSTRHRRESQRTHCLPWKQSFGLYFLFLFLLI